MKKWSASLFKGGYLGAFMFPWVIPAALLSSPFNPEELKHCARVIREASLENDGKIVISDCTILKCFNSPGNEVKSPLLFGPKIELTIPPDAFTQSASSKIVKLFSPLIIGSCLLSENEEIPSAPAPKLFFRAAALSVMSFRFIDISDKKENMPACKWKLSELYWLPPCKKNNHIYGKI